MIPTRSGGAIDLRSTSAAWSRRATCGEPAPAMRISSKARWTYASQFIDGTVNRISSALSRYRPSAGNDGVHEGRNEEADRELAGLVLEDTLHDARRELTHRELDDHHRNSEDEGGQG